MGEIDKRGSYITKIPFKTYPEVDGVIIIDSDNKYLNEFLETEIRQLLRDIYYGDCDKFEL